MDLDLDSNIKDKGPPASGTGGDLPLMIKHCQCDYKDEWESDGDHCPGAGERPY